MSESRRWYGGLLNLTFALILWLVLIQTAAFSMAGVEDEQLLIEGEKAFTDYYAHHVESKTDSVAVFGVTALATRGGFDNRQYSVEAKQEWLYGRFVIYRAKALTAADGLNGVEFDGLVRVEADALRLTAAEGSEPEALEVAKRRHKDLNGPWRLPNGADFERYSLRRVKGEWKVAEYNGGWGSDKPLLVHWLCGKPRPEAGPVDEAKLKAECLGAFGKVKRATNGGFALRYLGYDDPVRQAPPGSKVKVHDLLVEYRGFGDAKLELVRLNDAERANGIEARFLLREWDGARFVREASVRELKDGEVKPRLRCSSPGVEVSSEWSDLKLLILTAEKVGGGWRFSTLDGEAVGE